MKIKLAYLRKVISEQLNSDRFVTPASVLLRLNEDATNVDSKEFGASLDAQVDKYLTGYEKEAKTSKNEGGDIYRTFQRLMEADESEPEEGTEEEPAAEEPAAPTKLSIDDIDVEVFVGNVARLIENYDNLLEVQSTLIKRSINFIAKSYDSDVVKNVKDAFKNQHSMIADKTDREHEGEDFRAPRAGEAGPL